MPPPNITRIGKYEVLEIIGRGGMGLVYRAFDRQLSREVAIKTVTEGFAGDQEMLARFYREAAKTGALKHPNIVIVYDLGEQDGFPYIVMEYLSGDALDKLIRSQRPVSMAFKVKVIEQVSNALGYAHRNDVIHRDVKPGNVIVQPDGVAKLLDFGIASQEKIDGRLTRTGHVIGTVQYMAPERLQNRAFDGRSDIFSTGILLFQLLTGQLPFTGEDYGVVQKILNEKHPLLSSYLQEYPKELDAILDKALAKDPRDRYSAAEEMADDLSGVGEQLKREQAGEFLRRGQEFADRKEYAEARDILLQLLKIDPQNALGRRLLSTVQQSLSQQARAGKLRQLQSQAAEALSEKRYEDAIACLEEASKLDPSSAEFKEMLSSAQQKKRIREQIQACLRQADSALEKGDLKSAQAIIAKAVDIDSEDTRVRAAHGALMRRIGEMERQVRLKSLLEEARGELDSRHFTAALKILDEAEQVDPSNPAVISLISAARLGREQEQRRRMIEQLQVEMAAATTIEQLTGAARLVDEALSRVPAEPQLLKFKMKLAAQIREAELRRHVDDVVQRCRPLLEASPREALQIVGEELNRYPTDERLLSLQSSIEDQLSHWTLEKARASYLSRAREALDKGEFPEAVRLLQNCQAEGIFSQEIKELLDVARHEVERQQHVEAKQKLLQQAQDSMSKADYGAVIELLSGTRLEDGDPALRSLLEKAYSMCEMQRGRLEIALRQIQQLIEQEQYEEALAFAEAQPSSVTQNPVLQQTMTSLSGAARKDDGAVQKISLAYAALQNADLKTAWMEMHSACASFGSPSVTTITKIFEDRCRSFADREVADAIRKSGSLLRDDPKAAVGILTGVGPLVPFASVGAKSNWQRARRQIKLASALRRFGIRMSRFGQGQQ